METVVQKRIIVVIFIRLTVLGFLICIASLGSVSAGPADPNFYYYSSGRKIPLVLSKKMLAVRFKQGVSIEQQKAIVVSEENLRVFSERKDLSIYELTLLTLRQGVTEENVVETISRLTTKSEVEAVFPLFGSPEPVRILTDEFIVKFNPNTSEEEIRAFNTLHNVEIARKPEWTERYTLKVKDPTNMNTLRKANLYDGSPITVFSMPNFIGKLKLAQITPNDYYFEEDKQWPLHNFGQDPPAGDYDADIDAPEGWEICTGSSNIVIAVLDEGVDLTHEDLVNKLVDGYDAYAVPPDNEPSPGANCLSTQRGVRQFARLVRVIKNDVYLNSKYGQRADDIIAIIKHDIINDPHRSSRFWPKSGQIRKDFCFCVDRNA